MNYELKRLTPNPSSTAFTIAEGRKFIANNYPFLKRFLFYAVLMPILIGAFFALLSSSPLLLALAVKALGIVPPTCIPPAPIIV